MTEKEEARERKMVGEEGSWPGTYAAALCQAPLAEAAHAYAVLPLLLLLQPAPTPTLLHYLVKQSCRDKSGKSLGLPRLSSAGPGGDGWSGSGWTADSHPTDVHPVHFPTTFNHRFSHVDSHHAKVVTFAARHQMRGFSIICWHVACLYFKFQFRRIYCESLKFIIA